MLPTQLPMLTGVRLRIARWLYLLVLAGVGALVASSLVANGLDLFRNIPASAHYGFRTATYNRSVLVYASSPAVARAGLQPRDRLLAIDGVPLPDGASEFVVGHRLARQGGPLLLTVARFGTGATVRVRLFPLENTWSASDPLNPTVPLWLSVTLEVLSLAPSLLVPFIASFLISRRRYPDAETMLIAFGLALQCCNAHFTWWLAGVAPGAWPFVSNLSSLGWMCALIAIAGFPDGKFTNVFARIAAVVAPLCVLVTTATGEIPELKPFDIYAIGFTFAVIALMLAAVWQRYRATPAGDQRQQIKWAIFGTAISILGVGLTFGLMIVGARLETSLAYPVRQLVMILTLCGLPLGLLVSQRRYRLYDADAAISRSVALGLLTLGLLAIFAGSEKLIELLGEEYLGESLGTVAGALAAAVAAVTIAPLHHRISHWAEHRFQGALAQLRSGLPLLLGDLRETATPQTLADMALLRTERGARARHGAVVVGDRILDTRDVSEAEVLRWFDTWRSKTASALDIDRADPFFPVRVRLAADGIGDVGWLFLGPRPDGSFYGRDERQAFAAIADPLARALSISLTREEREAARVAERGEMLRVIGDLRVRVDALEGNVGAMG